jgi:hypothetical protein
MPRLEYRNVQILGRMLSLVKSHLVEGSQTLPFPVTVTGVTVVDARAARSGVPVAVTVVQKEMATYAIVVGFMLKGSIAERGRELSKQGAERTKWEDQKRVTEITML